MLGTWFWSLLACELVGVEGEFDIRHSYNEIQYLTKLDTIFTICMKHELNGKKMKEKK